MLWPVVLPFQITVWLLAAIVLGITAASPSLKWKTGRTFVWASLLALVGFIPSCIGISVAVDAVRFGAFEYDTFGDIRDARYERYLPPAATNISMHKHYGGNGYRARYMISEAEFHAYLNDLWEKYLKYSSTARGGYFDEGRPGRESDFELGFGQLGWEHWGRVVIYHSPSESDGGGATYYFDREAGIAYQRTGFW